MDSLICNSKSFLEPRRQEHLGADVGAPRREQPLAQVHLRDPREHRLEQPHVEVPELRQVHGVAVGRHFEAVAVPGCASVAERLKKPVN